MKTTNTILVGIDYSENCRSALREASRIANWNDAKLVCLHVLEEDAMHALRLTEEFEERTIRQQAHERLETYVGDTLAGGHDIDCRVQVGKPFAEVVTAIELTKADLLVLGTHGLASNDPGHVGPLARRCVRRLPINVLLVQERQQEPFSRIVAGIDFSDTSIKAAHLAAEIAVQDKATLELLHIYRNAINAARDGGGFGPSLPEVDTTEIVRELQEKLDGLAEELTVAHEGCEVRARVEERGVVSKGIVERLDELDVELAVIGTTGHSKLKDFFIGSTAERLIYRVPCSVLAVKA